MIKNVFRGLAVAMVPMTASFPQVGSKHHTFVFIDSRGIVLEAVFMYWMTSNVFSLSQTLMLKIPGVKPMLNIPDAPTPTADGAAASGNPFAGALDAAKKLAKKQNEDESLKAVPPPPPPIATFSQRPPPGKGQGKGKEGE
jgi:hypothetical protein